ncbi:MAG: DNA mismatch repair endonuclease MutL [Deltaproteobacteria bacterium]|nr:DNA mismatch repair endonuclease MutL [Deltaproteobacteria bacterium]
MAQKIQVLSGEVVNRIAAGEVVERPASVVKELVENAVDAEAREILIHARSGGLRSIRVVDDGTGMEREDALTAFQRHATSKIRVSDDLERVSTLGFRGEALPSIASVSRVRMVTREHRSLIGTEILLEAGQVKEVRETGCRGGTDITVEDLFFNTPARRKFQRSVATEFSRITEVVVRIALAECGIHFKLFHNDRQVLDIPPTGERLERIGVLLGREVYRALRRVKVRMDSVEIEGYLSDPAFTRPNSKGFYFYVNRRFVRDRIIHHAVMEAYRNLIPKDRYPVAILFLDVPFWNVDANVHPTKIEVRFRSTDLIHRGVIGLSHGLPGQRRGPPAVPLPAGLGEHRADSLAVEEPAFVYGPVPGAEPQEAKVDSRAPDGGLFSSTKTSLRILGQIGKTYLVCESSGGLILVDQHAAHERIVFERLKRDAEGGIPEVQTLLFPETVELSPAEWEGANRYFSDLKRIGFDLEPFGHNTVAIKSVPSILSRSDSRRIVSDILRGLAQEEARGGEAAFETVLKVAACHGAIRAGQVLSHEEMTRLVEEMEKEGFFFTCPHGRPACLEIGLPELARRFKRSS